MLNIWNIMGADVRLADASADGTMPTRAYRYCEAMRLAAGAGIYVSAVDDFDLLLDDTTIMWRQFENGEPMPWTPLQPSAWLPGWDEKWNAAAPPDYCDQAPPTLTALREAGTVQIVLGIIVQAPPDLRVWVRAPANVPRGPLDFFEGIMECARGRFAFINARITRTNVPVPIRVGPPLAQLLAISAGVLRTPICIGPDDEPSWADVMGGVQQDINDKPAGTYATAERKRMKGG